MDTTQLVERFRSEVMDEVEPYLWSDTEVLAYADKAQEMLCRLTNGIQDSITPEVCQISYARGDIWVNVHPKILRVRFILKASDGNEVHLMNFEDFQANGVYAGDDYGIPYKFKIDNSMGRVEFLVLGMQEGKGRLVKVPDASDVLNLTVERLPLCTIDGFDQKLEVRDEHHEALLLWMKHRAYMKQDGEAYDKVKADENEVRFRQYATTAKQEKERLRHKYRSVKYGGI